MASGKAHDRARPKRIAAALGGAMMMAWSAVTAGGQEPVPARVGAPEEVTERPDAREKAPGLAAEDDPEGAPAVEGSSEDRAKESGPLGVAIRLHDPSGRALTRFYRALRRVERGEGKARLLFYGASHTAMDDFTGHLRQRLQARFGDGGPGFVLPVQPFRWYAHRQVRIRNRGEWRTFVVKDEQRAPEMYGLAGYAVETTARGASGSVEPADRKGKVAQFELYYLEQPGGGRMDLYLDGRRVQRIATAAEEKRPAYAKIEASEGFHRFEIRSLGEGPVRLFGVTMEREGPGVIVEPVGVSGSRAYDQLPWDESIRGAHLQRRDPDLITLAYGTNESTDVHIPIAEYESLLKRVLARIRRASPRASCLLIGPSDRPIVRPDGTFEDRLRTRKVIAVQKRVAANYGCAFFDLVAFMGGSLSMPEWVHARPPLARDDYVHFTDLGHQRLAEVLEGALLEGYEPPARPVASEESP